MINKELNLPLYAKMALFFIGLFAIFTFLYIGQSIIVPLVFSGIIAILLHPIVNFLEGKKINRIIAIIITLFLTILIIAAFGFLLISQVSRFTESWPILVDKFTIIINNIILDASVYFEINPKNIHEWISKSSSEILNSSNAAIGKTLVTLGSGIVILFLIPVYTFLILFYHPLLLDFIHKLFGKTNKSRLSEIVSQIKTVIQRYLVGLVIETAIIATLEIITLLALGIEYAVILGIIGALLNLIPYIGGIVAVALPIIVALVTKTSNWYAFWVLAIYYLIQLIDNNYIVPKIVASKVKINALFSIIAILVGNALWGIPGMFLSIPLLAIVKLICDHIEPLKPWGFLLGDTMPSMLEIKPFRKKPVLK